MIGAVFDSDTIGVRGNIYINPATHLGPNGEVITHFNYAQRLYLIPY